MGYRSLLIQRLHGGEQQHVADGGGIGQQHHEAVDAKAQAAGGREAVLQRGDVVVVDLRGGVGVLGLGGCQLALEARLLVDGVVELGERVAVLAAVDEVLVLISP